MIEYGIPAYGVFVIIGWLDALETFIECIDRVATGITGGPDCLMAGLTDSPVCRLPFPDGIPDIELVGRCKQRLDQAASITAVTAPNNAPPKNANATDPAEALEFVPIVRSSLLFARFLLRTMPDGRGHGLQAGEQTRQAHHHRPTFSTHRLIHLIHRLSDFPYGI